MKTREIAPGSILQRMYLKERLKNIIQADKKKFIEVGAGTGYISNILLSKGCNGIGFDLNESSCDANRILNHEYVVKDLYEVSNSNFLNAELEHKYDIIISCMVIEHMENDDLNRYFTKCFELLSDNGVLISLVPACMDYWGVEDEIAGHYKRYTFNCFNEISRNFSFSIIRRVGLTFPISNLLFPLSNYFVKKAEFKKSSLTKSEQTVLSSNRKVLFKTDFPKIFYLFINELTMFPFHVLQKIFKYNNKSMVIYCEMKKNIK
jgi:phospholipid N-methyltransferase